MNLRAICVFCGSNYGANPLYESLAKEFGYLLAASGRTLVYGGGKIGLMGVVADAALAKGGKVIGVIPQILVEKEQAHPNLSCLEVVKDLHERKARMMVLSDAFVALPGGLGTYEEFFEVLSWSQIKLHEKPCGALNINGFFEPLLQLLKANVVAGFMRQADCSLLLTHIDPGKLLAALENYQPIRIKKWLPRGTSDLCL